MGRTVRGLSLLAIALSAVAGADFGMVSNGADISAPSSDLAKSAAEFDESLACLRKQVEIGQSDATALEQTLWQRIKHHGDLLDESVMAAVNCWSGYEGMRNVSAGTDSKSSYQETKRLIGDLLPALVGRPSLVAWLLQKRAVLLALEGNNKGALNDFQAAVKILTPVENESNLRRHRCLLGAGDAAHLSGDTAAAEAAYLQALSYDWYLIADAEPQHAACDVYVAAGRGLITVRRHNLAKLKDIHFVPSTMAELGPMLADAIKEAENGK